MSTINSDLLCPEVTNDEQKINKGNNFHEVPIILSTSIGHTISPNDNRLLLRSIP